VAIAASWRRLLRELTTTLYHVILALLPLHMLYYHYTIQTGLAPV